ncbi:metallophosphatase domain-containing protein [uncultured Shimia sp.]|uniref:metallophosphatase domain-containing protein n=1 Tax=uncultured Shimia sp. TaxID=573152 RepID=UPI00262E712E|nr:metallophosphatase domain-containing protein [uncultured Shimia sp.]
MKIVIISDTHGRHADLGQLSGDVLIHCGDFEHLFRQEPGMIARMDDWFGQQDFDHILCVGGNHDVQLEHAVKAGGEPFRNATFLHGRDIVIEGLKFYGASWVPDLSGHAFFADDSTLKRAWAEIPGDTDVLITHTPPAGVLDVSSRGLMLGCPHLAERLNDVRPKLHCFGHVHASAGHLVRSGTTFVNASSVNSAFEIAHIPVELKLSATSTAPRKRGWISRTLSSWAGRRG